MALVPRGALEAATREFNAAEGHLVLVITEYDLYLTEIRRTASRGAKSWREARINLERQSCFQQLTEM